jgi:hypothetical protein
MKPISLFILLSLAGLYACDRTNNDPGYDFFPDMAYSKGYETYSENDVFPDGKTLGNLLPAPFRGHDTPILMKK